MANKKVVYKMRSVPVTEHSWKPAFVSAKAAPLSREPVVAAFSVLKGTGGYADHTRAMDGIARWAGYESTRAMIDAKLANTVPRPRQHGQVFHPWRDKVVPEHLTLAKALLTGARPIVALVPVNDSCPYLLLDTLSVQSPVEEVEAVGALLAAQLGFYSPAAMLRSARKRRPQATLVELVMDTLESGYFYGDKPK